MIAPEIEPKLSEAQVRAAMLSHIASHCCYGKTAAKNMTIKKMEYLPAYHYELQTFTEKRETSWTYAAIRTGYESILGNGGGLGSGLPPLPWEIFEEPAQAFKDEVRLVQVRITFCWKERGERTQQNQVSIQYYIIILASKLPPLSQSTSLFGKEPIDAYPKRVSLAKGFGDPVL